MAEKHFEHEDPFSLNGMVLPVPKEKAAVIEKEMAECFIEEYMMLGYDDAALLSLFKDPFYQATHDIYKNRGEEYVRELIGTVRSTPEDSNG